MQQINNQARVEDSGKKHKEKLEGSSFDICWPRKYEKEKKHKYWKGTHSHSNESSTSNNDTNKPMVHEM